MWMYCMYCFIIRLVIWLYLNIWIINARVIYLIYREVLIDLKCKAHSEIIGKITSVMKSECFWNVCRSRYVQFFLRDMYKNLEFGYIISLFNNSAYSTRGDPGIDHWKKDIFENCF